MCFKKQASLVFGMLLIFIVSLLSFTWFEKDLIYSFGDFTFNFSPRNNIEQFLYIWSERTSGGVANFQNFPNLFPYQLFLYGWDYLNLPLYLAQRLLFWFLFLCSGLSMYVLILTITKNEKRHFWAVISGLFYMINPFSLVLLWGVLNKPVFFYAFLPLLLALYIKLLENKQKMFRYILLFILVSLIATPSFSVLTYVADLWLVLLGYLIFRTFFGQELKKERLRSFGVTILLLLFWFSINAFWFLPYQSRAAFLATTAAEEQATSPARLLKGASREAQLFNTSRLFGYNVFYQNFMEVDPFYPYAQTYRSPLFIFLGFLIPVFVFLSLFSLRKNDDYKEKFNISFFIFISLFFLFFFKGINKPFGDVYVKLAEASTLFALAFRNPIDKIGLLATFGFSVLFGYTFYWIIHHLSYKTKKAGAFLVVLFCLSYLLFYLFPFWKGQVFYKGGKIYRSSLVKVPDYYWQAAEWLKGQKEDFRIFPVPLTDTYGLPLQWENGHDAATPLPLIFDKPIFLVGEKDSLQRKIWWIFNGNDELSKSDVENLRYLLSITQVKYFVLHDDVAENYFSVNKVSLERVKKGIEKYLSPVETFGKLRFFTLKNTPILPKMFLSDQVVGTSSASIKSIKNVRFERENPTKWFVDIKNLDVSEQTNLIFLTKFDSSWKVYLLPVGNKASFIDRLTETWSYEPLNEDNHQEVFDYANLWKINLEGEPLRIVIEYTPQRLFYVGLVISSISFLILLVVSLGELIIYANRKQKKY